MLPGFRFLFAAIVLSMSVLVFGLGAAALLRAAHEQFVSIPARRAPPEPVFARQDDPPPTLALLRVEPEVAEKVPDPIAPTTIVEAVTPAPQASEAPPAEPEKLAALKTEEPVSADPVKPEIPAAEPAPAVQAAPAEKPIANEEVKLAAIAETPPPVTVPAATTVEPVQEPPSFADNPAALKIATLGGPPVTIEEPEVVKPEAAKPKRTIKRKRAERKKERRRIAAARRAHVARQMLARQIAAQQQPADPFSITPLVRGR